MKPAGPLPPIWDALCRLNPHHGTPTNLEGRRTLKTISDPLSSPHCLGKDHAEIIPLIASIPDPVHTHLGLVVDRTVDAVQTVAARASYLLYLQALPWRASVEESPQPARAQGSPPADDTTQPAWPGLLIFRYAGNVSDKDRKPPQYLAVFLVPESPAGGLDKESFYTAVRISGAISTSKEVISFAGPMFSGSVASLLAIDQELQNRPESGIKCVHALSASVTNPPDGPLFSAGACSDLHFIQDSDQKAVESFMDALCTSGYKRSEIAVLTEEGTEYGQPPASTPNSSDQALYLRFPREISRLRNMYVPGTTPSAQQSANSGQTQFNLTWQDSQPESGDSLPSYGGPQLPLSQQTVLAGLAGTVKTHGVKALGILATDAWDVAFLIHVFKELAPDVRLFVREPDLLYLRVSDVGSLNGVLAVNNFPLVPQNQIWSTGDPSFRLVIFPSAVQEAQFNVLARLLEPLLKHPPMALLECNPLEGGLPAVPAVTGNASPCNSPLWLAVTGTTGYFPLRILNPIPLNAQQQLKLHSLDVGKPPYAARLLWMSIALIGVLHGLAATRPRFAPSRFHEEFDFSDPQDAITAAKAGCHVMALLVLALASLVAGSSFLFFSGAPYTAGFLGKPVQAYGVLAWAVQGVTAFIVILAALRWFASVFYPWVIFLLQHHKDPKSRVRNEQAVNLHQLVPSSVIASAIFSYLGWIWIRHAFDSSFENAFFHWRNLNLASGVAPVFPILFLLAVVYIGSWVYLRRLAFWEYGKVEMPSLPVDETFPSKFRKNTDAIDCWMIKAPPHPWLGIFLLILVSSILVVRLGTILDMLEVAWLRYFTASFFFFAFLLLWMNWFRFIGVWRELRTILRDLEHLPLRSAFNRLPRESSLPIWSWSISDNTFLPTCQAVDNLRALKLELADNKVIRDDDYKALMQHIRDLSKPDDTENHPQSARQKKELLQDARQAMTTIIETLIPYLGEYWQRGSGGSPAKKAKVKAADRKYLLAENLVALRFYSYIRYVVCELRNLMFFLVVGFLLLFFGLHTYAFRTGQSIDWTFLVLLVVWGGGVVWVLAQMEKDALLSRLEASTAGQLGKGFYLNLLKYGFVPLLTVIGSQVPSISNLLLRWVQPTLEAFR
jgi:hypothetical protein